MGFGDNPKNTEDCNKGLKQFCLAYMRSKNLTRDLQQRVHDNWDEILKPVVPIVVHALADKGFQKELYYVIDEVVQAIPRDCFKSTLNRLIALDDKNLSWLERKCLGRGYSPDKVRETIMEKLKAAFNIVEA